MSKTVYWYLARAISSKVYILTEAERNGLKALLDGFNQKPPPSLWNYTINVNYDKPIGQLIKDGKYTWKDHRITSPHFPSTEKGQAEVIVYLFKFDFWISGEEVVREMNRQGFRPATFKELLALGAQYPDLQRSNTIAALGSTWRDSDGDVFVPYLIGNGSDRDLDLHWWNDEDWDTDWKFAALRVSWNLELFNSLDSFDS